MYKQEEFAAIDAEIKKHEVVMRDQMKKKEEMVRSQHKEYKIAEARKKKEVNQARRARELEERKKDYIPVALDEVYVPGGDETSVCCISFCLKIWDSGGRGSSTGRFGV